MIVDGGSTDGTLSIIQDNRTNTQWVSEKDGIYDAMNKAVKMSRGDVVGLLNSDDVYVKYVHVDDCLNQIQK